MARTDLFLFLAVLGGLGTWLAVIALAKPRIFAYIIFALSPTQYIFIPVSDFYVSPADVLVLVAMVGLVFRLAAMEHRSWQAVRQHQFIALLILSYCIGFLVLGVFSRTVVRVAVAVVPSVIACELLQTRNQLKRALAALIAAAVVDAGYGLFFIARGTPLYPGRFAGMSGVNFSAITIVAAAVIAMGLCARSIKATSLWRPTLLGGVGLSTLSLGGALGLITAWLAILRRVVNRSNKVRLASALIVVVVTALSLSATRERIMNREAREVMKDGVSRNSLDVRWAIIQASARAFGDSPVFGLGYSKFIAYSLTDPEVAAGSGGLGHATHNTYLEILVEGGSIAFALFCLHWMQYVHRTPLVLRALREHDLVAAACFGAFGVAMVGGAFANVLLSYYHWSVCGVALAYLNVRVRERRALAAASGAAAAGV